MKETKCVIEKNKGKITNEDAHIRIDCDLEKGAVNVELVGSALVHMSFEDHVQEQLLGLMEYLVVAHGLNEMFCRLESEGK